MMEQDMLEQVADLQCFDQSYRNSYGTSEKTQEKVDRLPASLACTPTTLGSTVHLAKFGVMMTGNLSVPVVKAPP